MPSYIKEGEGRGTNENCPMTDSTMMTSSSLEFGHDQQQLDVNGKGPRRGSNASSIFYDTERGAGASTSSGLGREKGPRGWMVAVRARLGLHGQIIRKSPCILLLPLIIFTALAASGLIVTVAFSDPSEQAARQAALNLAVDTGHWFSNQLDQALFPLFSLAQFATELDIFQELPDVMGPSGAPGSVPLMPDPTRGVPTHRNVTGVCDNATLVNRFNEIAATIKKNANMHGVLVNLQLAPEAVVCLVYPLNNTEDFTNGTYLDISGSMGHDLLADPDRNFIAKATLVNDTVRIAGPLVLKTCPTCDPAVKQAFIARLAVQSIHNHTMIINGIPYPKWGLAIVIISWNALLERSDIYERFRQLNLEFQLTRTDRTFINGTTGDYTDQVVVLAQTDYFDPVNNKTVSTTLQTTNNEWMMTVGYTPNGYPMWRPWAFAFTFIISLCIAVLVYTVLIQKYIHSAIITEGSALLVANAQRAAKAERALNDYIAHEVRNPLSAAMSACAFVSVAMSENQPLVDAKARESVREDVAIIEASLQFINELLRSMLDVHRARSRQLKLELADADILKDIFEPVSAMLYRRDENFDVIVECPESFVVHTDRLRLQQIVLNLGRNAAKFTERGFIKLRAEVIRGTVRLSVEDSGPGIPPSKRKNLFVKFQESLDSLSQGTGIGLNLCKTLVDLMEGEIWLDETYDSGVEGSPGARIVIDLLQPPVQSESEAFKLDNEQPTRNDVEIIRSEESATDWSKGAEQFNPVLPDNISVLFVDDERVLRKLAARSIEKIAPTWTVREAASGETAIQILDQERFDLIFMDQYMTSTERLLTGVETVRVLRAKGIRDSIIVGLSANELEEAFMSAGANAFLLKPFPCKACELEAVLLRALRSNPCNGSNSASTVEDAKS